MPIKTHQPWTFEDPLVVVGFPSQGLVGAIVATYVVPALEMQLVATLDSPHFPPVASIRGGRALAPVQFYASTKQCGLDGECDQLVVVRSDVMPPPEHADAVAGEVLDWAAEAGAKAVVTLEGAPSDNGHDKVFAVANLHAALDLERLGVEAFPDGAVSGMSGALLTEGNAREVPVVCLFTPVNPKLPDAAGAARLVDVTDRLVPGIKIDAEPLEEQARKFEAEIRASLKEQQKAMRREPEERQMMYG